VIRPASWRAEDVMSLALLFVLMGVAGWLVLKPLWSSTFGPGDWHWITTRGPWTVDSLLGAEGGWWASVPIALFKVVLSWKGLLTYHEYAALGFAGHLAAVLALYLLTRTKTSPWIALGAAVLLLFFGAAGLAVFTAPGLMATLPAALGCVAWVLWDRPTPGTRRDAAGTLALLGALASGPAGLAFATATLATFFGHRPARRRLIWPALAVAPMVAWQIAYGSARDVAALIDRASGFIASLATALLGVGPALAPLLLLLLVAAAAVVLGATKPGPSRQTLAAAAAGMIVLIITAGLGSPDAAAPDPALLYAGAALTFLAGAIIVGRWAESAAEPAGLRTALGRAALLAGLAIVLASQVHALVASTAQERERGVIARGELALIDRVRPVLPASSNPQTIDAPVFGALTPGDYALARDNLRGPPVWSDALSGSDKPLRMRIDALLFRLTSSALLVLPEGAPQLDQVVAKHVVGNAVTTLLGSDGGCSTWSVPNGDAQLFVGLSASQELYLRSDGIAPTQLFLRAVGSDFQEASSFRANLGTDVWQRVVPPGLPAKMAWTVRVDPPGDANILQLCVVALPPPPVAVHLQPLVTGLDFPVGLVTANDGSGRLFVWQRAGVIRVIADGKLQPDPFLDISKLVSVQGEEGLLGLAFHPSFEANGRFFVHYTDLDGNTVIAEYHAAPKGTAADPTSARIIMRYSQPTIDHNGGTIAFGPDGYLYIAQGDGIYRYGTQTAGTGQDLSNLLGKLLRIDVDHGSPYAIPPDNPFVAQAGARPEIWAYGLRNPWRFSFDRLTGDLWIGDVGHQRIEEVDLQPAGSKGGQNYGWNIIEGTACYRAFTCDREGLTPPLVTYPHEAGLRCAVMGGYVYRGAAYQSLYGRYLFADFCSGAILTIDGRGAAAHIVQLLDTGFVITSFGEDEAGELYVVDVTTGGVYQIVADR
jgi:glucose/arabinose dehydrogenase